MLYFISSYYVIIAFRWWGCILGHFTIFMELLLAKAPVNFLWKSWPESAKNHENGKSCHWRSSLLNVPLIPSFMCFIFSYCWWKESGLPVEVGRLSHDLQGFIHPKWSRVFFHQHYNSYLSWWKLYDLNSRRITDLQASARADPQSNQKTLYANYWNAKRVKNCNHRFMNWFAGVWRKSCNRNGD